MQNFGKLLPVHVSVNWKQFEGFLTRIDCPFLNRPEYCERCDGFYPDCLRPDMRPKSGVQPIGRYVSSYMSSLN